MMQRVGVAAALVNDPQLVILDEPTDGVDPVGRREIRDVLLRLRSEGRTVFVNSHLLSELEVISDRVAILVGGHIVKQGTLDELTINRQYFEIEIAPAQGAYATLKETLESAFHVRWNPSPPDASPQVAVSGPANLEGVLPDSTWIQLLGVVLRIGTTDVTAMQPFIDTLRANHLALRRLQQVRPSLEDLFIEAVGGVAAGHQAGAAIGDPRHRAANGGARP
jgi:ABC-2 type transport system ATP-binding protein